MSPSRTLSEFVLKVHSRCDLACDHCYVYEHSDQSWRGQPRIMAPKTLGAAAARIAEHAQTHELGRVTVILHGGEPLLIGLRRLRDMLQELRTVIDPVTHLDLRMQTNGVLLSPQLCDLLLEHGVSVGVSLDGDGTANDRHRRFADGRSSHGAVLRALALLRRDEYRRIYGGILCTVDVRNDPLAVYEALLAEKPPRIDFLLPHATWDQPPLRPADDATPYARWLRQIFIRWWTDGRPVAVRLFDSLLSLAAGGRSGTEAIGLDPVDLAVVETDGTWEQVDSLKVTYPGATATGFDVFAHSVDDVASHPGIVARFGGMTSLSDICRSCPVLDRCGGGLLAHRYRSDNGFFNPSVYCADLKEFITTMDQYLSQDGRTGGAVNGPAVLPPPDRAEHAVLDDIGTGYGSTASIAFLADAQPTITRALLVAVRDKAPTAGPVARLVGDAWDLLGRLDAEAPAAVSAVLTHPFVRAWAVKCLSASGAERISPGPEAPAVSYLACVAAAAAIHAGVAAELTVPVSGGLLHLPTLGRFTLASPAGHTVTLVTTALDTSGLVSGVGTGGGFTLYRTGDGRDRRDGPEQRPDAWQPVRRIDRDGLSLLVEETDPYRGCFGWPPSGRLADPALRQLVRSVVGAWQSIERDVPGQLPGIRSAQRVLVPLEADPHNVERAATARHAFGAVAVAPVAQADGLAVLLVHELQHAKLSAVLDLYDLVDPHFSGRLRVPWRPDPRPVEAVLHGTYAHLSVADVWRSRAVVPAAGGARAAEAAAAQYHRYRGWTLGALDELLGTGALTPSGKRFAVRMCETVASWPSIGGVRT